MNTIILECHNLRMNPKSSLRILKDMIQHLIRILIIEIQFLKFICFLYPSMLYFYRVSASYQLWMRFNCYWTTTLSKHRPWVVLLSSNHLKRRSRNGARDSYSYKTSSTTGWRLVVQRLIMKSWIYEILGDLTSCLFLKYEIQGFLFIY